MPRIILLTVLLLSGWVLAAEAQRDHLQCFKIKAQSAKAKVTADLTPDHSFLPAVEPGCTIKLPAKQICVDVAVTNVTPAPPGTGPANAPGQSYLCYKATCGKLTGSGIATDQFGDHPFELKATSMLCAPIVPSLCTAAQFQCSLDGTCIPVAFRCDGEVDCADGTDELTCP